MGQNLWNHIGENIQVEPKKGIISPGDFGISWCVGLQHSKICVIMCVDIHN